MRHLRKRHRLNRPQDQRKALLRALATSLFTHGEIVTTLAKAKALKPYAEKIISKAKQGDLHSRRLAAKMIYDNKTGRFICHECNKISTAEEALEAKYKCADCEGRIIPETVLRKLFRFIGKDYADRQGGYTRIYHKNPRTGDAAKMALIQLV